MSTYRYIAQRRDQVPVRQLCQVLRAAPSAYYAWQRRQAPALEPAWQVAVRAQFNWHSARYGTRRLRTELLAQGYRVGRWRIRRALAAAGLRALTGYDPATPLFCAPHHRLRPERTGRPKPIAGPARAHGPQPGLGRRHHLLT